MAHVELLFIDARTDIRSFTKEVRWNQVYWRLA
jgi:L-arabinose isomerase